MSRAPSMSGISTEARSRYRTIEEMVVWAVREAILRGTFKPGEKLPQEPLAQALGVSRIPVRAAFRQLEAEGLVVLFPNRGAFVRSLDPSEVEEIYDLRIILETFALRSAMERVTEAEIEELSALADRMDDLGDGEEFFDLRQTFYQRLYDLAGRPRTAEMISKLRADVGRYWLSLRVVGHGDSGHRVITDAIRARDPVAAEAWLEEHLTKVSKELQLRVHAQHRSGEDDERPTLVTNH
jgi:DNA-binding GntR family transcriptional regulator